MTTYSLVSERGSLLVVHLLLWSVRHTRWAHSFQTPDVSFQHHPQRALPGSSWPAWGVPLLLHQHGVADHSGCVSHRSVHTQACVRVLVLSVVDGSSRPQCLLSQQLSPSPGPISVIAPNAHDTRSQPGRAHAFTHTSQFVEASALAWGMTDVWNIGHAGGPGRHPVCFF